MDYKNFSTSTLINKCCQKDPLAWAEFVKRYQPLINFSIRKTLLTYSPDIKGDADIEDIEQDIVTSLWSQNRLNEIKNREKIDYWLVIIARNTTINYLRRKSKEILIGEEAYFERFTSLQKSPAGEFVAEEIKKDNEEEEKDSIKKIEAIYARLSPREKVIFKLYFKKKLHLKDVAKIMGLPLGTVSSAITRMRKKLKNNAAK